MGDLRKVNLFFADFIIFNEYFLQIGIDNKNKYQVAYLEYFGRDRHKLSDGGVRQGIKNGQMGPSDQG